MLLGIDEELGSARELALIFMKNRENKIRSMETYLISKALFISGTDSVEDKNKQIGEYNKLLSEYQDLTNPQKVTERKKFERSFKEQAKGLKGMKVNDLVGGKKLTLGKKPKENFSKTLSANRNWSKVE